MKDENMEHRNNTDFTVIKTSASKSFQDLGLKSWLVHQCASVGVTEPTPVQSACVPEALTGENVIGCAKTGTGKTLAFILPILHRLSDDPYGIFALVLTPTRELAFQIAEQFRIIGKPVNLQISVVVGGRDFIEQGIELSRRPHVVVATPGRLHDHITSGNELLADHLKFLVLDEADRLLDDAFADHLRDILDALPKNRQTLLFSATITDALVQLSALCMGKKPVFWQDENLVLTVDTLDQRYVLCPQAFRDAYLVYVAKRYLEKRPTSLILVFTRTCRDAQALMLAFRELGFRCASMHSLVPQRERLSALARFRSSTVRILICTDVAARGLDIPMVDLVMSHNAPLRPKAYVHRVGRAARAGRTGDAILFMTPHDVPRLHAIEEHIGIQLKALQVSDKKVAECVTEVLVARRDAEMKLDEDNFGEKREINQKKKLIMEGKDPEEVEKMFKDRRKKQKKANRERLKKLNRKSDDGSGAPSAVKVKKRKTVLTEAGVSDV